jgi:hypothetical protein
MFSVKWVSHLSENELLEIETSFDSDLDRLAYSCIERLSKMRMSPTKTTPDGFLIHNAEGTEVRRWFDTPSPIQKIVQLRIQNSPKKIVFVSDETITWCKTFPQGRRGRGSGF